MKVRVDQNICRGSGICVEECPEVFYFTSGDKKAHAVKSNIPKAYEASAHKAAADCPVKAITVIE